jgi:hypothetical protein
MCLHFCWGKKQLCQKSDGSIWAWGNIEKEMFDYSPIYIMSVLNLGEEIFLSDKYGLNLLWEDIDWENTIFSLDVCAVIVISLPSASMIVKFRCVACKE